MKVQKTRENNQSFFSLGFKTFCFCELKLKAGLQKSAHELKHGLNLENYEPVVVPKLLAL